MATQVIRFTRATIDATKHPVSGTDRYRDERYPNVYLEVGTRSKTWRFRKFEQGRNTVRTLGHWPKMDWLRAAREADNTDTSPKSRKREITLFEAFERHTRAPVDPRTKLKSETTIYDYENALRLHAADWLDKPIDKITRADVNARIKSMSSIPTTANKFLRIMSAIYGNELSIRDDFNHDPTYRVRGFAQRGGSLLFDIEKPWPVLNLVNEITDIRVRALWNVILFTGIRVGNARHIEWDHLDLKARQLTIPKLKNGQSRTFPLADAVVEALSRVPQIHDRWVFASATKPSVPVSGLANLGNPKALRPHDTRRLFTTAATMIGLSDSTVNFLRGDVTLSTGARGRYIFSAGSHDDVNAIQKQIVLRCSP